jgi:hypothetical protein
MSCTIVTAYYPIRSKFTKDKYLEWGKTFLKLKSPIVIFTEEHLISELSSLRGNFPIKFISLPFEELDTWKLYKDKWVQNHTIDPENSYHTPELYAIWAQKAFFVEMAIKSNYFNTNYFFWCDFGAFRDENIDVSILNSFPTTTYFTDHKLLLQSVGDLTDAEKNIKNDGIYGERISNMWNDIRLVGGLWGGSSIACLRWKEAYQTMLEKYFIKGRFAGKDQIVMLSTYLENPTLATVIKPTINYINNWFFFQYILSNQNISYELNNTYSITRESLPIISVNIMGGLGNQLFQIATAYAYARKESGQLCVYKKKDNGNRPVYWDTILKKIQPFLVENIPTTLEPWYEINPTTFSEIGQLTNHGKYLNGYLQSSKYFYNDTIKQEIKELFKSDPLLIKMIREKYDIICESAERVIVVHARRTDYNIHSNFHGPLTGRYYKDALQMLLPKIENPIFLLTSDDNNFWSEIKSDIEPIFDHQYLILDDETDINTFILLQQFQNFIMSNSTFIWWAVWLSNYKNVIVPAKWFGPEGPQQYEDIYENNWERI